MPGRVVVDASHANSGKDHVRQIAVARELAAQVAAGDPISGIMLESFLVPGRQNLTDAGLSGLVFGQSITDACMGWDDTVTVLEATGRKCPPSRAPPQPRASLTRWPGTYP